MLNHEAMPLLKKAILDNDIDFFKKNFTVEADNEYMYIYGYSLLHLACTPWIAKGPRHEIIQFMLEKGANTKAEVGDNYKCRHEIHEVRTPFGLLLSHADTSPLKTIKMYMNKAPRITDAEYEMVIMALTRQPTEYDTIETKKMLSKSVIAERYAYARELLKAYQTGERKIVNILSPKNETVLQLFAAVEDKDSVGILLKAGADANLSGWENSLTNTKILPIHQNIGNKELFDLLASHTKLNPDVRLLLIQDGMLYKNNHMIDLGISPATSSETESSRIDVIYSSIQLFIRKRKDSDFLYHHHLLNLVKKLSKEDKSHRKPNDSIVNSLYSDKEICCDHTTLDIIEEIVMAGGDYQWYKFDQNQRKIVGDGGRKLFDLAIEARRYSLITFLMKANPKLRLDEGLLNYTTKKAGTRTEPWLLTIAENSRYSLDHLEKLINLVVDTNPETITTTPVGSASPARSNQIIPVQTSGRPSIHLQLLNALFYGNSSNLLNENKVIYLFQKIYDNKELRSITRLDKLCEQIGYERLFELTKSQTTQAKLFMYGEIWYSIMKQNTAPYAPLKAQALLAALDSKNESALITALKMKDHEPSGSYLQRRREPSRAIMGMNVELQRYVENFSEGQSKCFRFK